MKTPKVNVKGLCGFTVQTKTWKQGHSIKCNLRMSSSIRYWQPEPNIFGEVIDFCRFCEKAEAKP